MVHILQGKQSSGSIGQSHSVTNSAVPHVSRLKRKKKKEVWVTGLTTCMFGLEGVRLSLAGQHGKTALANGAGYRWLSGVLGLARRSMVRVMNGNCNVMNPMQK